MSEITQILSAIEQGDPKAAEQLLPLVYDELRKLAALKLTQEAPGQTLQSTALVHEAYLRLVANAQGQPAGAQLWDSRRHFFAAAAEAMRRILVDRARDKHRLKRGGGWRRLKLDHVDLPVDEPPEDILALDEALEKLARQDKLAAELVKLRFFGGLTLEEAARSLEISPRSADRYWAFARSWLFDELRRSDEPGQA
jgi:RNA polymerase sigma factor (TIGR02999 family)